MFMMFSGFRAHQTTDVNKVLSKENLKLEDIFSENDFTSWVKNNLLHNHMMDNPKFMEKMIDYCLIPKAEFLEKYKDELPKKKIEVSAEEKKEQQQQQDENNEDTKKSEEEKKQNGENNNDNDDDDDEKIKQLEEEILDDNSSDTKAEKKEYRYEDYSEEELQKIMSQYAFNSSEFFNETRSNAFQLFLLGHPDKEDDDSHDPNYMGSDSYDESNVNNNSCGEDQIKQEVNEEEKQAEKLKKEEEEKAKLEKGKLIMKQILKFLERDQDEVDNYDTRAGYFYKIMSPIQFIGHFLDFLINETKSSFDEFSKKIILKSKNPNIREAILKIFFEDDKSISNNDQENKYTEQYLNDFVKSLFNSCCQVVSENKNDTAMVETCCQIVEKILTWFSSQIVIDENIQNFVDVLFSLSDDQDSIYSLCKLFQNIVEEIDIDPEKNAFAKSFNKIVTLIDFRNKTIEPEAYKNQCRQAVYKFGFGNLEIIELLYLIVKKQKVKTEDLVLESEIFNILQDLIVRFEWNSLVQTSVFKLISEILKCENDDVTMKYLKDTNIVDFIQDNFESKTKPGDYKVEVNRGYHGLIINLGYEVQKKKSSSIGIQVYLEEKGWNDFAKEVLFNAMSVQNEHEWGKCYNTDHPEEYEKEKQLQKTPESERKENYLKSLEVNFNQDYLNQRRNMFDDDDDDDEVKNDDDKNDDNGLGGLDKGMKLEDINGDDDDNDDNDKKEDQEYTSGSFWKLTQNYNIDDLLDDII